MIDLDQVRCEDLMDRTVEAVEARDYLRGVWALREGGGLVRDVMRRINITHKYGREYDNEVVY